LNNFGQPCLDDAPLRVIRDHEFVTKKLFCSLLDLLRIDARPALPRLRCQFPGAQS
jgi:hypothetical protein